MFGAPRGGFTLTLRRCGCLLLEVLFNFMPNVYWNRNSFPILEKISAISATDLGKKDFPPEIVVKLHY